MEILRAGTRASTKGPEAWFTGTVRIDPLFNPFDAERVQGARQGRGLDGARHGRSVWCLKRPGRNGARPACRTISSVKQHPEEPKYFGGAI